MTIYSVILILIILGFILLFFALVFDDIPFFKILSFALISIGFGLFAFRGSVSLIDIHTDGNKVFSPSEYDTQEMAEYYHASVEKT